ncbi:MAG: ribonuclease HI [Candidatus Aminicenantes bacterium]|nr:MAG: ribonuclease HI [Candidatus Aminicenantes bacterium]
MGKSKIRFYAVAYGRNPGIYDKWYGEDGAEAQVKGFPNARFQGFTTRQEAKAWLKEFQLPENPVVLEKAKVIIYTDGGCIKNPGTGGYGVVLLHEGKRKELSAGFRRTTNNRMELMACIEGLKALKYPCSVNLYSDSQYVVNGIKKGWAKRWRRNGWMRNLIEPAENIDLWKELLDLCDTHSVKFSWVKGHAGNRENERCDRLAKKAAANKKNLLQDTAFETSRTTVTAAKPGTLF